jgi:hypothetical protein
MGGDKTFSCRPLFSLGVFRIT